MHFATYVPLNDLLMPTWRGARNFAICSALFGVKVPFPIEACALRHALGRSEKSLKYALILPLPDIRDSSKTEKDSHAKLS